MAITVRLPWAAAIRGASFNPDAKLVENRGRPIAERYVGQRLAIHAGAAWDKVGAADPRVRRWWYGYEAQRSLDATDFGTMFGRVLAVATLTDCHRAERSWRDPDVNCCSPWGDAGYGRRDAWHLLFADVVELEQPVETRGYLPVPWALPEDVAARVLEQVPGVSR